MNYENVAAPGGDGSEREDRRSNDRRRRARRRQGRSPPPIKAHGYPASADPNDINYVMTVILLAILVVYVTMVYGPIAAWLVELFPTRIRYSGVSLPYHIGNGWFGGFLPATVFAIVAATGNIYSGLWYPIVVAAMSFVVGAHLPARDQRPRHHAYVMPQRDGLNRRPAPPSTTCRHGTRLPHPRRDQPADDEIA